MHTGKRYKLKEFLIWTRRDIYWLFVLAVIPTVLYKIFNIHWVALPWVPIAMVGTAAAFIIGFKNTQTYNRLWEARQIWGAIVNSSRSWGILSRDFIKVDKSVHQQFMLRHCAWLTALRYQLREPRTWENSGRAHFKEYRKFYSVPEWEIPLEDELKKYLSADELHYVLSKKNRATQVIALQSKHLKELRQKDAIGGLEHIELENMLANLYEQQGKCERIKNFPYPRQFASITLFFVWMFVILLPMGMLGEFARIHPDCAWFAIPFSMIVSWVFTSMDRVGEATENPFEGGPNDIPMANMSRTIEIDLREMLDEENIPTAITPVNNIVL
ncbi:MAG: multidrug transporter [Flavobacterium sp.]|uniref:bestrophin family protein n=1 Tax=Flavobacterium sp. TaxID=239 RepID=UPI00121F00C6|nr:bestrophin family ion channel [Flavobacterium sp.]RZJ68316.1 MAG: multidrug transporter [Flavobacterium sp.]